MHLLKFPYISACIFWFAVQVIILIKSVCFLVSVPVLAATISLNNDLITMSENSNLFLTCTTSECRPKPKFLWYKDNSIMTDGEKTILSQSGDVDSSVITIQTYTDSVNINLTRDLNGWYIFCSANNYNDSFVLSKKIQLNVTCKYLL